MKHVLKRRNKKGWPNIKQSILKNVIAFMPGRMAKVKEDNGEQIGEEVTIFLIAVTCVEFFKILTRLMLHAVFHIFHRSC